MKKILTVLIALIGFVTLVNAQSSRIGLTSYQQIERVNGKWPSWPSGWTNYVDEGRSDPEVQVSILNSDPYIYNLVYFIDGAEQVNFEVVYDPERTTKMRTDWKTQYVNCYSDSEGNYIYVQGTSLDHLAKDPSAWGSDPNTKIYMWANTENVAVVVK